MSNRASYLAAIQSTDGKTFRPIDIAKGIKADPAKVRVWLSRDKKKNLVETLGGGRWRILGEEDIGKEIERIKRNGVTGGSTPGSRDRRKLQVCRLHGIEYKSALTETRESIGRKLADWQHNRSPNADHYWLKNMPLPGIGCNGTYHIATGPRKTTLQLFIDPLWTNSWKLYDQLDAIHNTAQLALRVLAIEFKVQVTLLEVTREGHYAISIPATEGWRLAKVGYKKRGGKVWINEDWFIDESYGDELETMRAEAFGDLMRGLQTVGSLEKKMDDLHNMLTDLKGKPTTIPPAPTGQEIS